MATLPTVEIWREGVRVVINESDLPHWQAQGWAPKATAPAIAIPAEEPAKKSRKKM